MGTRVGAIVVNWNGGKLLCRCIESLLQQTRQPEVIALVDNASDDGSAESVQEQHPEIKVIRLSENLGFAAANNLAIAQLCECEWIALANPDAFPEPKWLESLVRATQTYPQYDFYASRMLLDEEPLRLDGAGDVYHTSGAAWRRGHGQATKGRHMKVEEIFSPCAAAALYRRDVFLDIGGFDGNYFCYFEDVDLGFRLRLAGHRCLYVPDAIVHHVGSVTTGGQHSDFSVYHGHRNLVWTYFKNMPWPLLWLYLPQHLLLNLVSIVYFALRGQGRILLKAKWDAIKGLPRILNQRRRIQQNWRVNAWQLRQVMARGLLTPYLRRRI
jgi:GT2 family glycosyltransferase